MPTINILPKKHPQKRNRAEKQTEERALRQKFYNTAKWRKCRATHLVLQPLCQECLKEGKVYAGSPDNPLQVHHIKSPFIDGKINWDLALDDSNLVTICSYHHGLEHAPKPSVTPEQLIEALDALFAEIDDES